MYSALAGKDSICRLLRDLLGKVGAFEYAFRLMEELDTGDVIHL